MELADAMGERVSTQPAVERLIAVGYGLTYDAIVRGFAPYQALLDEIAALVASGGAPGPPVATRVLDVSCGIGDQLVRLWCTNGKVFDIKPESKNLMASKFELMCS